MVDHGHSPQEISDRIGAPPGRGVLRDVVYGAIDGSVTTFAIGAFKSHWALTPWWRSGAETLAIGGAAAALAYGVGRLFQA
ncbi:VIT1/CCC1 transporter family protein [Pseudophaeobacter arcticus]|jgi:VIT1/CCC1 family predicted Fe2+/Mn2+ transporter|uniref:VIT1/CCC1 transporter family protein n=1 Tax=Pseudophaeobacter arcticus TaxID=385492 RepID=UPI002493A355|nr:hypothetical protein [Pseudophaeobacter arcticus]